MKQSDDLCRRLHEVLEQLPAHRYPIHWRSLPSNGVYFFYESGEYWGHGGQKPRVVRIGAHREGNLVSRMRSHYVADSTIRRLDYDRAAPKDRSIFRKNIGRALLAKSRSRYLKVWDWDATEKSHRALVQNHRDIMVEQRLEKRINRILAERFWFRVLPTPSQEGVLGVGGLEARLIGTVAGCGNCRASDAWLGHFSPQHKVRHSGLWLSQHLDDESLRPSDWPKIIKWCAYMI
jgi:hypothetical protein